MGNGISSDQSAQSTVPPMHTSTVIPAALNGHYAQRVLRSAPASHLPQQRFPLGPPIGAAAPSAIRHSAGTARPIELGLCVETKVTRSGDIRARRERLPSDA